MKKQLLLIIAFLPLASSLATPVFAMGEARATIMEERQINHPTAAPTIAARELTRIQTRAGVMIDQRITALNALLARVSANTRIIDSDKAAFSTDIQTTINNLQSLKAKIQADTDAATALTDAKSIVSSYHVYAIYEPKIRLLVVVDNLQSVTNRLTQLMPQLTNLTSSSSAANVQTALTDMNTKLSDMTTKLANDKTTLNSVSVTEDIATAEKTFASIRQDLATVRADLAAIRSDLATLKKGLNLHKLVTPTP